MSVAAGVRDKASGKISLIRVTRYQRGKLPEWAHYVDHDDDIPYAASAALDRVLRGRDGACPISAARDDRCVVVISREELRADHRRRVHRRRVCQQADAVSAAEEEEEEEEEESEPWEAEDASAADEDDEEEAHAERKRRIWERWLLRGREEELLLPGRHVRRESARRARIRSTVPARRTTRGCGARR